MANANGLTAAEEKALRGRQRRLEAILKKRCLLGGADARQMAELVDSIKLRLNPPTAETLAADADRMLDPQRGFGGLTWVQATLAGLSA